MSLRDFNAPFPNDPRALHNEPLGNGAGLETFHTKQPEDIEPNNTPKIIGAVAVALMIGTAGIAFYTSSGSHFAQPQPVVASNLPAPAATQPPPAAEPVAQEPAAMTPDANTPQTAPQTTKAAAAEPAAPVKAAKKHRMASADRASSVSESASGGASARMAADSTQSTVQPQQQAVTAPAPSPSAPSPSDVATNNTQSGVAVSPNATTASDMPAASAQNNSVAEPQAQPSAPQAPAQSAGQVNP
jgi:hypothetical protein